MAMFAVNSTRGAGRGADHSRHHVMSSSNPFEVSGTVGELVAFLRVLDHAASAAACVFFRFGASSGGDRDPNDHCVDCGAAGIAGAGCGSSAAEYGL